MARIRSLKPEFFHDRKLARTTSINARMLYMGLWGIADEWGRCNGDPLYLKGQIFPYDDLDVDPLVDELEKAGRVVRYWHDDDPYLFLPKLDKHQRLEPSKSASRLPVPPDKPGRSAQIPATQTEPVQPSGPIQDHGADPPGKSAQDSDPPGEDALLYVAGVGGRVAGVGGRGLPAADAAALTVNQRAKKLTDIYHQAEPMSKWPAVNGIVIQAIKTGRWSDQEIHDALLRLAAESRSVTVDVLRTEIVGFTPRRTNTRTQQNLALVAHFADLEAQEQQGEIA